MRLRGLRQIGAGIILLAALLAASAKAGAQIDAQTGEIPLSFSAERNVPLDADVETVCCGGAWRFGSPAVEQVTLGFGEAALWLRIELAASSGLVQVTPILDDVTLHTRAADGTWRTVRTGDQLPVNVRLFASPFMALPIPPDIADTTVFVRVVQPTAITVGAVQWELPAFVAMQAADQVIKTFLFGFICAMILFNSIVWVLVRDPAFLLNACTISGVLLVALYLSGYGAVYVWPFLPGWSNSFFVLGLVVTTVAGSGFMWVFIRPPGESPVRAWPVLAAGASAALAGAAYAFLPFHVVNPWLLASIGWLLLAGCGLAVGRALRGDAKSRILLVPLLLAMLPGTVLVALDKLLGIRPFTAGNNMLEITLCVEAVLFSLALTSRIRLAEQAAREAGAHVLALRDESAARAIEAQDAERRRLALELHDGAGQSFLFVLNALRRLSRTQAPPEQQAIAAIADTTAAALTDLRRISRDMHPSSIEHLGLGRALEGMFSHLKSDGIDTEVAIKIDEKALSADAKLHVYRVAQECLANTVRHADATRVRVSLKQEDGSLCMAIEDDGIGFHPPPSDAGGRLGLGFNSISERVRTLRGQWTTGESELGGLVVRISIPLEQSASRDAGK